MTDLRSSQIVTYSFGLGEDTTYQLRGSQITAYAWGHFFSAELRSSQQVILAFGMGENTTYQMRASQIAAYAWCKGYVEKPHLRAWGYSLDGHDYYVLRLGTLWTVVLDLVTGQWSEWSGHSLPYWRAHNGGNWLGEGSDTANRLYGTNVVAGDDRAGILWMLDPTAGIDDGAAADLPQVPYSRAVTAIVPQVMRQTTPVGGVYLTVALGQPTVTGAEITFDYSDTWGKSYISAGSIEIDPSNYTQEIAWRSVGLIRAPGRIFRFTDTGATVRISLCEMK